MKNTPSNVTADANISVLSVSPNEEDHSSLQRFIGHSRWAMDKAPNISAARLLLAQKRDISVVVCDCDVMPGMWIDILNHTLEMAKPPSLIVTSRLADDRLWAEALNLGVWDVLAKPFDRIEVVRSVRYAWEHWRNYARNGAQPLKAMRAAS